MTGEKTDKEFKDSEAEQEQEGERFFFISIHQIKFINETQTETLLILYYESVTGKSQLTLVRPHDPFWTSCFLL